jgi:hypothetical protein
MFSIPAKRIIASYVFDWIAIALVSPRCWSLLTISRVIAAIGGGLNFTQMNQRPFSLVDLSISYPYLESQIATWLLVVVALIIPGAIIFVVCLVLIPGRAASAAAPRNLIWRRKLWEWNSMSLIHQVPTNKFSGLDGSLSQRGARILLHPRHEESFWKAET